MILWSEYDDNDDDKETREIDNDDGNNNIAAHRDKGWFHIDQNPHTKTKFTSIQGLVNLLPVMGSTGGNVLAMGSHIKIFQPIIYSKSRNHHHLHQRNLLRNLLNHLVLLLSMMSICFIANV